MQNDLRLGYTGSSLKQNDIVLIVSVTVITPYRKCLKLFELKCVINYRANSKRFTSNEVI